MNSLSALDEFFLDTFDRKKKKDVGIKRAQNNEGRNREEREKFDVKMKFLVHVVGYKRWMVGFKCDKM